MTTTRQWTQSIVVDLSVYYNNVHFKITLPPTTILMQKAIHGRNSHSNALHYIHHRVTTYYITIPSNALRKID